MNSDVFVTVGDNDPAVRDSMLEAIVFEMLPVQHNAYLTGHGQWDGVAESAGALLYTDLTPDQAEHLRTIATVAGYRYSQQAVGVTIIPAGSALVFTGR